MLAKNAGDRHTTCGLWLFVNGLLLAVCAVSGRRDWRIARMAVCAMGGLWLAVWGLAVWAVGGLGDWAFRRLAVWAGSGLGGWRFAWLADCAVGD